MFKEETVIVIGAGASAEFGLPTGRDIFNHIAVPENPTRSSDLKELTGRYGAFDQNFERFYKKRSVSQFDTSDLDFLLSMGRQGYHGSIDLLAIRNPSIIKIAKILCSWSILSKMYSRTEGQVEGYRATHPPIVYKMNSFWRNPRIGGYNNWIGTIAEKFLREANTIEDLEENKLSIVSFNYDTIFLDALTHFVTLDEIFQDLPHEIIPKVHHVFGELPPIQSVIKRNDIVEYAQNIKFMEEVASKRPNSIEVIRNKVSSAKKILLVGFDCHRKNTDLIGLNETGADIYAINYNGNEELKIRLIEGLGLAEKHIMSGTIENPIGASKAFDMGFLSFAERFSSHYLAGMIV